MLRGRRIELGCFFVCFFSYFLFLFSLTLRFLSSTYRRGRAMGLRAFMMYDRDTSRFFFFLIPFHWFLSFFGLSTGDVASSLGYWF
jgi:hypothetical protein